MGSKYISICSVDEDRLRQAFGSGDRKVLNAWLRAIRKRGKATYSSEDEIEAEEEAAEQLIAGTAPGESKDSHYYTSAFRELCELWADDWEVIECAIGPECRALVRLTSQEAAAHFGLPTGPYSTVYYHASPEINDLRVAFAEVRAAGAEMTRYLMPYSLEALDRVLGHAQQAGRGVIVFYLG